MTGALSTSSIDVSGSRSSQVPLNEAGSVLVALGVGVGEALEELAADVPAVVLRLVLDAFDVFGSALEQALSARQAISAAHAMPATGTDRRRVGAST
ncbi:hypothetical protein M6D93_12520 [Jatrophihabitans telluris]|uniref:Uncharacterized protein n=1 Tax=Jatrophihabitans telluris TaxID=2038343 RepID=A0ABY4QV40_9ACTN|nr:hypothetical protein [Jatrophihabitans telluris]UQX87122.1 hypothetical protein M6D93_12520 [Jatrophihabitans telluris]